MLGPVAAQHGKLKTHTGSDLAPGLLSAAGMLAALLFAMMLHHLAGLGPLSTHMGQHIVVMNAAAPFAALALVHLLPVPRAFVERMLPLALATLAQILLLWGWHVPAILTEAWRNPSLMILMHVSLFASAVAFWYSVFTVRGNSRWRPILALLVTGKLFCLLGALLIFAPRTLYATEHGAPAVHVAGISGLADQQLAGLLMITACPLTYVLAGVIIAARWILELEADAPATATRLEWG